MQSEAERPPAGARAASLCTDGPMWRHTAKEGKRTQKHIKAHRDVTTVSFAARHQVQSVT